MEGVTQRIDAAQRGCKYRFVYMGAMWLWCKATTLWTFIAGSWWAGMDCGSGISGLFGINKLLKDHTKPDTRPRCTLFKGMFSDG